MSGKIKGLKYKGLQIERGDIVLSDEKILMLALEEMSWDGVVRKRRAIVLDGVNPSAGETAFLTEKKSYYFIKRIDGFVQEIKNENCETFYKISNPNRSVKRKLNLREE